MYNPAAEMVPPHPVPVQVVFTVQLTAVLELPVTVAVNWRDSLAPIVGVVGSIVTRTPESTVTVATAKDVVLFATPLEFESAVLVAITTNLFCAGIAEGAV